MVTVNCGLSLSPLTEQYRPLVVPDDSGTLLKICDHTLAEPAGDSVQPLAIRAFEAVGLVKVTDKNYPVT